MQQIHANSDVQALKKVLRAILISDNRNGMPMYLLERAYRDREGTRIPLFGYPNTRMLLAKLDDTVTTEVRENQLIVYPVDTEDTQHIADFVAEQHQPRRNTLTIRTVRYGKDAKHKDTDYAENRSKAQSVPAKVITKSPRELGQRNDNGAYVYKYDKYGDPMTRSSRNNNPDDKSADKREYSREGNMIDIKLTSTGPIEDEYSVYTDYSQQQYEMGEEFIRAARLLQFDEENIEFGSLKHKSFDDLFSAGQSFHIYLSQVHSPYKFWFQKKTDCDDIDNFMEDLEDFYSRGEDKMATLPIPDEYIEIGRICAARYESQWHRAEIISVLDESVKVYYVDYGTVDEVAMKEIRFLHKQFSRQPIYVHRGCIDFVKPNDGKWTLDAMEAFGKRVAEFFSVPIWVKVTAVNASERTVYMDMIASGPVDESLAGWLITSGFAYATKKKLFDFVKRHYNEVYPSFDRLESGSYPSMQQMRAWLTPLDENKKFNFLEYEDSIIIPEMYGYETIE